MLPLLFVGIVLACAHLLYGQASVRPLANVTITIAPAKATLFAGEMQTFADLCSNGSWYPRQNRELGCGGGKRRDHYRFGSVYCTKDSGGVSHNCNQQGQATDKGRRYDHCPCLLRPAPSSVQIVTRTHGQAVFRWNRPALSK